MTSRNGMTAQMVSTIPTHGEIHRPPRLVGGVVGLLFATLVWGCAKPGKSELPLEGAATSPVSPVGGENVGQTAAPTPSPGSDAAQPDDWFEDRTAVSLVDFRYSTGREAGRFTILETVGGGVGIVDYDLDGQPDLFCIGGGTIDPATSAPSGRSCGLFRNQDGDRFHDVTVSSRLNRETDYSHGCVSGDVNSDGFPDVLITCYGQNCLLLNQGDGTFLDVSEEAGLRGAATWNTAAALGDVNRDGELDLYVAGYVDWVPSDVRNTEVPPPQNFHPVSDHLFLNSGDGQFIDVSDRAGVRNDGMGMGVIAADVNDDQRIDFYVANDVVENHLYLGTEGDTLREVGALAGVAFNETGSPEGSMGVDCADVNGDGRLDLFVTNFEMEDNSLYVNLGEGQFQHATAAFRLAGLCRPQVKFGTGLRDFDGDGWLDLFVVSGHVRYQPGRQSFLQLPTLCRNDRGTGFVEVTKSGGTWFRAVHAARGTATGDLDGDGGLDLLVSSLTEPVALLHNRQPAPNWMQARLVGTRSPRTPIGSRVSLSAFGRECVRTVTSGSGYLSHSEEALLLAVESERSAVDVTVTWPSGKSEVFASLPTKRESVLVEGRGGIHPVAVLCPLSPASDIPPAERHLAGERAGVRGSRLTLSPPHPDPLPHSGVGSESRFDRGGEGAECHQGANAPGTVSSTAMTPPAEK